MFIKYNGYDLLELFCSSPKILNEEADIFSYETEDDFGVRLYMYVSAYDQKVILELKHKEHSVPMFSFELERVERICAEKEKLVIIRDSPSRCVTVVFKPNFHLDINM